MKRALFAALLCLGLAFLLSGCALDDLLKTMVNVEPRAVIDAKPVQGPAPLSVHLDSHYSHDDDGTLVETRWDLGDPADTGSRLDPALTHEYKTPGTYIVKLTVTDNQGAMNSQQLAIVVTDPPPVAAAAVTDTAPHPGDEVKFDGTGSRDPFGRIVGYQWDFGDGKTASEAKPAHTYTKGGTYVVTLTVTDDDGQTSQATLTMNVKPGSSNCGGGTCGGNSIRPLAVITGLPSCSGGKVGVAVHLDGSASRGATGNIVLYQWDFGDGATASGATVEHTYSTPYRYIVTLTVTDEGDAVGSAQGVCSIGGSGCYSQ